MKELTKYIVEAFRLRDDTKITKSLQNKLKLYDEYVKCANKITNTFNDCESIYDDLRSLFEYSELDVLMAVSAYHTEEEEYIASFVYDLDLLDYSVDGQVSAYSSDKNKTIINPKKSEITDDMTFQTRVHVFENTYLCWDNEDHAIDFNDDVIEFYVDFIIFGYFDGKPGSENNFLTEMENHGDLFYFGLENFTEYLKQYHELGFKYDYWILRPVYDKNKINKIVSTIENIIDKYL